MVPNTRISDFDSSSLLEFLFKKRKPIIMITLAAALISAIASFLITPRYKSTVIMFPSTTSSISKSLLAMQVHGKYDITEFGEEEQAEQMLQMLNSDEIRQRVIEKYNLMSHYDIEENDPFKHTKLKEMYEDNISFKRTEFMSVKVEVLDTDRELAADIANDIASLVDSVKNRMQRERALQGFKIVEAEYVKLGKEIRVLEDSLNKIRALGINDYHSQSEVFNEQYAIALQKNDKNGIKALEEKLKILSDYGGAYVSLSQTLGLDREQFRLLKVKYDEAKVDAEQNITHKFLLDPAYPAEKKSFPVRWLIVTVSTISSLLLSVVLIIGYESISNIKSKESISEGINTQI